MRAQKSSRRARLSHPLPNLRPCSSRPGARCAARRGRRRATAAGPGCGPRPRWPCRPGSARVTRCWPTTGRDGSWSPGSSTATGGPLVDSAEIDVVTWAPTTVARRRQRGFDQAELLGRSVARRLHKPARALLRRRPGPAQTGQPAARRRSGPRFETAKPVAGRVLLVDDVITTGATVTAAALVLWAAGATEVVALAAARTPPRRS